MQAIERRASSLLLLMLPLVILGVVACAEPSRNGHANGEIISVQSLDIGRP
jgi:hypothetical protein